MLMDGLSLIEGSDFTNLVVGSNTTFPLNPDLGELFYLTAQQSTYSPGLYFYKDNVWNQITTNTIVPYDLTTQIFNSPTDDAIVLRFIANRNFVIPQNLAGSKAYCVVLPTAASTLYLKKNDVIFGTISFSTGSHYGTFAAASSTSFSPDDILTIVNQPVADDTLADISITLYSNII